MKYTPAKTGLYLTLFCAQTAFSNQVCDSKHMQPSVKPDQYIINSDNTVTDTKTGLIWQRCLVGQTGKHCKQNTAGEFTWAEALIYAGENSSNNNSVNTNWRLPNVRELESIVELQCGRPAVNLNVFSNNPTTGHLWSSSPYKFYSHYSWYVDFEYGLHSYSDRQDQKYIRLVRDSTN